jgi:hypothetical protein
LLLSYVYNSAIYIEGLIDGELDLPEKLPGTARHEGIKHKPASRRSKG